MRRRSFIQAALVAGLPMYAGPAHAQEIDDDYPAYLEELELLSTGTLRSAVNAKGFGIDFSRLPSVWGEIGESDLVKRANEDIGNYALLNSSQLPTWAPGNQAADYSHLSAYEVGPGPFKLNAKSIEFLLERNSFDVWTALDNRVTSDLAILSIRGCQIIDGSSYKPWAAEHDLVESIPDHQQTNCVMAIWRRSDNMLAVYRASTVPVGQEMFGALRYQGLGASLLPTGMYGYRRGTHLAGKPLRRQQPGALLMDDTYAVLRTAKDLVYNPYSATNAWTQGAGHNIHASGSTASVKRFSSAGCQVVCGYYVSQDGSRLPTGNWKQFQIDAGLVDAKGQPYPPDNTLYRLVALTGREYALAFQAKPSFLNSYHRLRPGSSGTRVDDLQTALRIKVAGARQYFGVETTFAVLDDSKANTGEYASHIYQVATA